MTICAQLHETAARKIVEFRSDGILLKSGGDMLELLMQARASDASNVAVHEENICPEFFDPDTGVARDVMQKLANYRGRLLVVGDISRHLERNKSLKALVWESNRGRDVTFVADLDDVLGD